jgi:hypothetical protein
MLEERIGFVYDDSAGYFFTVSSGVLKGLGVWPVDAR